MPRAIALTLFVAAAAFAVPVHASEKAKTAGKAAGKPAAQPAKEVPVTPAAASPGKPGPADLSAVAKRIEADVADVAKKWESKPRPAAPKRQAPSRVRLEWRPAVSWPEELQDAPAQPAGERPVVSWGNLSR